MPFNPASTDIEEVHKKISEKAAEIANQKVKSSKILPLGTGGDLFREGTLASERGGLCIIYDPMLARTPEVEEHLNEIGRKAMHEALIENQDLFVGLILGEARSGRNYFRVFKDPGEQMELF